MSHHFIDQPLPLLLYYERVVDHTRSSEPDHIRTSIIDTTTGYPAANIQVTLRCAALPGIWFVAQTDTHGAIENWKNTQCEGVSDGIYVSQHGGVTKTIRHIVDTCSRGEEGDQRGTSVWRLEYATGPYFGERVGMESLAVDVVVHKDVKVDILLHVGLHGFNVLREITL